MVLKILVPKTNIENLPGGAAALVAQRKNTPRRLPKQEPPPRFTALPAVSPKFPLCPSGVFLPYLEKRSWRAFGKKNGRFFVVGNH